MKILHLSDTHIGYSAYRKVDEATGLNQREVDVYRAFEKIMDRVLEIRPDAVLHSGDLFDSVRPTNRALSFVLEHLVRLDDAGIPLVIISGNHSTPRLRETGSVHRVFEHLENVFPVYKGVAEKVEISDMMVHALPHTEGETMRAQLEKMVPDKKYRYNVAMMHGGVVGLCVFRMGEFNEQLIHSGYLRSEFDYIALGHYHGFTEVTRNAFYAGSTERFSFAEAGQEKGFILVDLERKDIKFESVATRPMLDLGPIDATNMGGRELQVQIIDILENTEMDGKIVRLRVKNISPSTYQTLDFNRINDLTSTALHFERAFEIRPESGSVQWKSTALDSLEHEFVSFLDNYAVNNIDKDVLKTRGLEYLKRGLEESD